MRRAGANPRRLSPVDLVPMLLTALLLLAPAAGAHPLAPSLLELNEGASGRVSGLWRRPVLLPAGVRLEPVFPAHCRAVAASERLAGAAIERRLELSCGERGLRGATLAVSQLDRAGSEVLLLVTLANGETLRAVLRPKAASYELPSSAQGWVEVGGGYLRLGVEHLLTGWDHLAFVLGLVLVVVGRRRLIATLTAFTLGHSLTLSLAALSLVRFPPAPIEALIAVSILLLALELTRERRSVLGEKPWWMAAGFGLLHGLGFAGALAKIGFPQGDIPLALFSFNLGIELGQLLVVALLFALGSIVVRTRLNTARSLLPRWCAALPAYGLGTFAAFWTFERLVQW